MSHNEKLLLAQELVTELEAGNSDSANEVLTRLNAEQESVMFRELGKLTRELHDALANVKVDSKLAGLAENEIPDARSRLDYVITKTEEAAHKTLNVVEELMPMSTNIREAAKGMQADWERFTRREMSVEEFRELSNRVGVFLEEIDQSAERINGGLGEVLMAQDFQDLTGQVIRRIMNLVQEVEHGLIGLIRRTSSFTAVSAANVATSAANVATVSEFRDIEAEGPQIKNDNNHAVADQDEVDELLSNLGF